jgi:hypothetical protein
MLLDSLLGWQLPLAVAIGHIPEVHQQLHAITGGNTLWVKLHPVVRPLPVPERHDQGIIIIIIISCHLLLSTCQPGLLLLLLVLLLIAQGQCLVAATRPCHGLQSIRQTVPINSQRVVPVSHPNSTPQQRSAALTQHA